MRTPDKYESPHGIISDDTADQIFDTLPLLGRGYSREVVDLGDVVLKLAYEGCEHDNLSEARMWERVQDETLLAPVVAYSPSGRWLIMRKAGAWKQTSLSYELSDLRRRLAEIGVGDVAGFNVGYLDGNLVSLDYAHNTLNGMSPDSGYGTIPSDWEEEYV